MGVIANLIWVVLLLWASVLVHEAGHYACGRILGVPGDSIRLELRRPPAHVALWDGQAWRSPDDDGYAAAFRCHRPSTFGAFCFVAAGFIIETVATASGPLVLAAAGAAGVAALWAVTSLVLFVVYVSADVVLTAMRGTQYGDASVLWSMHRPAAAVLLGAVAAVKIAVLGVIV